MVAAAIEVPDDGEAAREEQKCGNNYNFPPYKISPFFCGGASKSFLVAMKI